MMTVAVAVTVTTTIPRLRTFRICETSVVVVVVIITMIVMMSILRSYGYRTRTIMKQCIWSHATDVVVVRVMVE